MPRQVVNGLIDEYDFLSRGYKTPIEGEDGIVYPSLEHYFQAHKTLDMNIRKKIAEAASPILAARVGNAIELRSDWEKVKRQIMLDGLKIKFKNEDLRKKLLDTKTTNFVDINSWHDNYWGKCTCATCRKKSFLNIYGGLLQITRKFYGGKR